MTWSADRVRRWVKGLCVGPALYDQGFARLDFALHLDPLADAQGAVGDAGPNSRHVNRQEINERFMKVRLTQGILGFGVLAFALWFYPGPAGAQQPENTVVCVEGTGAIPLNYGDNTSGCAIDPATDRDLFIFTGAAGTSIRLNVDSLSAGLDPRLEVLDPNGAVLVDQFCIGGSISTCSLAADLDLSLPGQYVIAVSDAGVNEVGSYQFSLNCVFGSSCLVITPDTDFQVEGTVGGPFDTIETYTLTNNGDLSVDFTASASENFVTLSQTSGTLPGRASTTVEVSINANADNLAPGIHEAKVDFKNATNGQGDTDRLVQLTVKCPGSLEVTPGTDYRPLGPAGGPFAPDAKTYTLRNPLKDVAGTLCSSDIEFSVAAIGNFINVSPTSGTLEPEATKTVTASLNNNANDLAEGSYDGMVTFTNTTFNLGDTVRGVTLLVEPTMVEPKPPWTIVPLLDLLLGPDKSRDPDSP